MWHVGGDVRCLEGFCRRKPEGKKLLEDPGVNGRIIWKWV